MSAPTGLVLLGFGGHARSAADVALAAGFERLLFVDENAKPGESFGDFAVQVRMPQAAGEWVYLPCAGDNRRRFLQIQKAASEHLVLARVISPRATIGHGATIEPGCLVGHHAHVGPLTFLGSGCVINTGAVVEHDCIVGACSHVSVNACVAGRSRLGERVFAGAGSVIIDRISVTSEVTIGAGGVVIQDIDTPGVYVGVPVRRARQS